MIPDRLSPALEALTAVRTICRDVLDTGNPPGRRGVYPTAPIDLAITIRRMQHAQFVHYLRCDAPADELLTVLNAIDLADRQIEAGDGELIDAMLFEVPYRHHLYVSVAKQALYAVERERARLEVEAWKREAAMTAE